MCVCLIHTVFSFSKDFMEPFFTAHLFQYLFSFPSFIKMNTNHILLY